jgi:FKBP-type peptidyl-prolyl cis-trans isomerase
MRLIIRGASAILILLLAACSASKKTADKKSAFNVTASGMQYMFGKDVKDGVNAKEGDFVEIHINTHYNDSLIFDSRQQNFNKPVTFPLSAPKFHGDLAEAIMMMSKGDSLVVKVAVDSIIAAKQKTQPWMKPGGFVTYRISLLSLKTQEQVNKENDAKTAGQLTADDNLLKDYFSKQNINPKKTASGLYYVITKEGSGAKPQPGQEVSVNYTGRLLNGTAFDSNTDPQFKHVEPFVFPIGRNRVIRGWDEGVALLNKGTKATFYIPSPLAYGANSPSASIPPNSILLFDVELIDIK